MSLVEALQTQKLATIFMDSGIHFVIKYQGYT